MAAVSSEYVSRMERLIAQLLDRVRLGGLRFEPGDQVDPVHLAPTGASAAGSKIVDRSGVKTLPLFR